MPEETAEIPEQLRRKTEIEEGEKREEATCPSGKSNND